VSCELVSGHDELAAQLEATAARLSVPGAVVGVAVGDRSYVAARGVDSVEHPAPITPATRFQVASVTKTFTSAVVMVLAQEGQLSLADPVGVHLPDLAEQTGLDTDAITIEIALSHQAGFDGDHLFVAANAATDGLGALREARRLFSPGQEFSYNNAGFSIVGAIVEAVTEQSFAEVVRTRLLRPLGMQGAGFRADDLITYPVAVPHWVVDGQAFVLRRGGWQPGWELEPIDHAAGGLVANVEHLLTWSRFQMTGRAVDGSRLLEAASLERLHEPVVGADMTRSIALDWFVRDIDGARSIGHDGVTAGYNTELLVLPEREIAFIGLTNATNGSWLNDEMRRWVLHRFADLHDAPLASDQSASVDRSRYHGRFLHAFGILDVVDGAEDGQLLVTSTARTDVDGWQPPVDPPRVLAFVREDHAVTIGPGPQQLVRFGFGPDGRADWLLWDLRRAVRVGQ
jgi:CubicO group peptidase (beta-lactamase class C family)